MNQKELPPPYSPPYMASAPGVHQQDTRQFQSAAIPPKQSIAPPLQQGSYPYPQTSSGYHPYPQVQSPQQGGYPCPYPQQQPPYPVYGTIANAPAVTTAPVPPPNVVTHNVIIVGGCPACRTGVLEDNYGLCAICCAILFFPLGILCCLLMKERRCSNCGAVFD